MSMYICELDSEMLWDHMHVFICTGAHRCWPLPRIWGIPNLYIHSEWFEDNRISNTCSPDLHNRQEKSSGTSVLEGLRDNNQ